VKEGHKVILYTQLGGGNHGSLHERKKKVIGISRELNNFGKKLILGVKVRPLLFSRKKGFT